MTLGAEFNVEGLISRDWNTLEESSQGMCSDCKIKEVEVKLLNSSLKNCSAGARSKELPIRV